MERVEVNECDASQHFFALCDVILRLYALRGRASRSLHNISAPTTMPPTATILQAEEVQKSSPEKAIPLYQSILASAGTKGMFVHSTRIGPLHERAFPSVLRN